MEEEESRFGPGSLVEDKKQKKLKDALDKNASKKKFAGLVKRPTTSGTGEKKGLSYKEYQENLKKLAEKKKADAERRKQAEDDLKNSFAAYGSSSSSEEEDNSNSEPAPVQDVTENDFKVPPPPVPAIITSDEPDTDTVDCAASSNLPPGFMSDPVDQPKTEDQEEQLKAGSKRKSSAEFGSNDFWSSITKKKS